MSMSNRKGLSVADVMLPLDVCPLANQRSLLKEACEMELRLGIACVVTEIKGWLVITEGTSEEAAKSSKPLPALLAER